MLTRLTPVATPSHGEMVSNHCPFLPVLPMYIFIINLLRIRARPIDVLEIKPYPFLAMCS